MQTRSPIRSTLRAAALALLACACAGAEAFAAPPAPAPPPVSAASAAPGSSDSTALTSRSRADGDPGPCPAPRRCVPAPAGTTTGGARLRLEGGNSPVLSHAPPGDTTAPGIPLLPEAELIARASVHALTAPLRWGVREWALAGGAVAGVALVSIADEDGRALMAYVRNPGNTRIEHFIEPFGAHRSLYILGGMLATGVVLDDVKLRATAVEGLAAGLVAAGIITPTLQKAIGRAKPREGLPANTFDGFGGHRSMPSGHTTQAFAVASVIAAEYDHPVVQVAAYGTATAVGVSRMYRRSHFLSDVVGAAMIGTVVGRAVARYGQEWRGRTSVAPTVRPGGAGVAVRVAF
jgi:membrane-associated phospholipid phosphatase